MTESLIVNMTMLFDLLLVGVLFWKMPDWSRPELFFAVTVTADTRQSAAAQAILARYRRRVVLGTAVGALGSLIGFAPGIVSKTVAVTLLVLGHLSFVIWAFIAARREASPLAVTPSTRREAAIDTTRETLPGGWLGQAGPFLIFGLVIVALLLAWPSIPERYISHWNGEFEPDGWSDKSPALVFGLPLIGAVMCLTILPIAWALMNRSRRVHLRGDAAVAERARRRAVVTLLLWVEYLMAAVFAPMALFPFAQSRGSVQLLTALILGASVLGPIAMLVAFFVRYGSVLTTATRGSEAAAEGAPIGDRTEDRFWKLGLVYYNPDDPVLWVEKRFGIGYTFNMARPSAWLILGGLIVAPLLITLAIVA